MNTNQYVLALAQALYRYPLDDVRRTKEKPLKYVNLIFVEEDNVQILDMAVITDISVLSRQIIKQKYKRLRKLYSCEHCFVSFARLTTWKHTGWCRGANSQDFHFEDCKLLTFEDHLKNCRDTHPVTIYYDLETAANKDSRLMKVISYAYLFLFDRQLHYETIVVYRSQVMTLDELLLQNIPETLQWHISEEDNGKLKKCAYYVLRCKEHAMEQMLFMEIVILQHAVVLAMRERARTYSTLPPHVIALAKADYRARNCYVCDFSLDDETPIPFRDSVDFCLRKVYMRWYCMRREAPATTEITEAEMVNVWVNAMEKVVNTSTSPLYQAEEVEEKKLKCQLQSLLLSTCYLYVEEHAPRYMISFTWLEEEELLNILNDDVVVHHNHYTGIVYWPVHKRCNGRCQLARTFKTNIYAHNATNFDHNFVIKGVNIGLLATAGETISAFDLLGETSERLRVMTVGDCIYKDSCKVFDSFMADLCKSKLQEECERSAQILAQYLQQHSHFATVYASADPIALKLVLDVLGSGKGYYPYDYVSSGDVLKETTFPRLFQRSPIV